MSGATKRLGGIDATTVWIAVGAGIAVLGIVSVFSASLDLSGFGEDRFRIGMGRAGVGIGAVYAKRWGDAEDEGYRPPERERVLSVGVPGDDLDELLRLRELAGSTEAIRFYRSQIRDELLEIAIEVLEIHRGLSEEEARQQLRSGTWTDDEVAATVFRLGTGGGATEELANTIRRPGGSEHPYTRRVRRAIEELTRIAEAER
jgi:hypothetical protein